MQEKETEFTNCDGRTIFCRYWMRPDDKHRALVFICHGFGEHSKCYEDFVPPLVDDGCLVFSHDHVGHGNSEGDRVHIEDMRHYCVDIFSHIDRVVVDHPNLPVFIYGHSMGGMIAVLCGLERPKFFKGMVLTGAALELTSRSWIPLGIGRAVAYFMPQFQFSSFDNDKMCRDPVRIKNFNEDPLTWKGGIKARWGISFITAMESISKSVHRVVWPILVMHGTDDAYTSPEGSKRLYNISPSKDKMLSIYEGCYHRVIAEPGEDGLRARQEIYDWIHERM